MDLSIIIVSFNTQKYTISCLRSIQKANIKLSYEIIIVDNGSVDGSLEAIKQELTNKNNWLLIENQENVGFSKANNQGIAKAKGKYIFLLNSDAELEEGSLEKLVDFAQEHPDAGVVAPRLLNNDGSIQASVFIFPTLFRTIKQYWLGKGGLSDLYFPKTDEPIKVDAVVGAAMLITPRAIKEVGLLNEAYFMFFEDLDYGRKIHKHGLSVYYYPKSIVVHHLGKSGEKLIDSDNQWRRLIPSSKIYHGKFKHYLVVFVMKTGQKLRGI